MLEKESTKVFNLKIMKNAKIRKATQNFKAMPNDETKKKQVLGDITKAKKHKSSFFSQRRSKPRSSVHDKQNKQKIEHS